MLEAERKEYEGFLARNHRKASVTEEPIVHVHFRGTAEGSLVQMRVDDVCAEFDAESELVRWTLEQMRTYDPRTQRIVALAFDRRTILSDVLRAEGGARPDGA
jgi:hypothetical protein